MFYIYFNKYMGYLFVLEWK